MFLKEYKIIYRIIIKRKFMEEAMSLLIKNGTIVTSEKKFKSDVFIENEIIKKIGENLELEGSQVIDARGMYLIPGG